MMISDLDLKEIIEKDNGIKVEYYFLKIKSNESVKFIPKNECDLGNQKWDKKSKSFLKENIERSRLGITLGSLIHVVSGRKVTKKDRWYSDNKYIHNLTKNPFTIYPKQCIIILSNEYIETDSYHSAIILPRVSWYARGLTILPSYINSGWKGILKIQITNNSNIPLLLEIGEAIAGAFFFKCTKKSSEKLPQSHHFNFKWDFILGINKIKPFDLQINQPEKGLSYKLNYFKFYLKSNWQLFFGNKGVVQIGFYLLVIVLLIIFLLLGIINYKKLLPNFLVPTK